MTTPSAAASPTGDFAFPGSRSIGCLLVHGFTATPEEMRPLGEALARAGFPVRGVRLAGHGTSVADLARTTWTDWLRSVEEGLDHLGAEVPRVAVAGMSMGALLALHLAATRPTDVAALLLCGTPLTLANEARLRWLPFILRLPWIGRRYAIVPKTGGRDVADPVARTASPAYDAIPTAAVVELLRLQQLVRGELARVRKPTLILHGRHDHTAPLANLRLLESGLGSGWVETRVLEESWHVVTIDVERALVGRLAADFLGRVEAAG